MRVLSVWMLLLSVVAAVVAVLLIPTYVLVVRQLEAKEIEMVHDETTFDRTAYEQAKDEIKRANTLATKLVARPPSPQGTVIFDEIRSHTTDGIALSGFVYEHDGKTVKRVEIRGTAVTREELSAFVSALESGSLIDRATVPVASLTRDRDLPFSITITLQKEES